MFFFFLELACTYSALILHDDNIVVTVSFFAQFTCFKANQTKKLQTCCTFFFSSSCHHIFLLPSNVPPSHYIYALHNQSLIISKDEKIKALLAAAKVTVKPYLPGLFARVVSNPAALDDLILKGGAGAAAAAPAAAAGAAAPAAEKKEEKKVEKKEEKKEESDEDMV